jgi:RimJ/RimL family protein N-acetyltransferase
MIPAEASYPLELSDSFALADDRRIRVRALRRCEQRPVQELFDHLSLRSRYFRFLSPLRELPDAVLRRLICVDYQRHLALVAEYASGSASDTVALASFGAVDDDRAEVALAVRDEWQRLRIGTAMAVRLLRAAESRGFSRFIAHVAGDNEASRKLIRNVGRIVSSSWSDGVSELMFIRRTL